MKSPARPWNQQWAIIRRHFTVMLHYPIRSLLRVLVWPGLIIVPIIYLLGIAEPDTNFFGSLILNVQFFIKITTLLHVYSMTDTLVADKANGMKSLMLSMGLSRINYYLAMAFCFMAVVLPIVVIIMTVTKIYLVDDSVGYFTMLALGLLFVLQLDAFTAASVSFITSSSYSFLVPMIVFIGDPLLQTLARWLIGIVGKSWTSTVLSMTSFSPYTAIVVFSYDYVDAHKTFQDVIDIPYTWPLYHIFASQVFWILFLRLFAYWFEEICPWQKVSAVRNFCFCLTGKPKGPSEDVDSIEATGSQSKYFEQRQDASHDVGIRISHVTKKFGTQAAVKDVSYTIYKGETTLLLGHNGAGKSTLMNIILGLLEPNDGYVKFKNRSGDIAPAVGVCPQKSILDDNLTIKQHLELFNDIKSNISGNERMRHIYQTIGDVSLAGQESKRPPELSGGMKRKLSLGMAFVGKSDVLILDEPSSGLDPDSRMFVWNAIRRYRSNRTVLLSTQHMEEADYLGDRIAIMSAGRIVCCGSSVYLNKLFGTGYKLRIECKLSKRQHVIDHFRNHYFDAVQPTEASSDLVATSADSDPIVDLVLALETKDTQKDPELELIKLLEDLENNAEGLSVRSYGLKSSSIEDVMLNTGKYFASLDSKDTTNPSESGSTSGGNISAVTGVRKRAVISPYDLLSALMIKHLNIYQSNWNMVILLKVSMPFIHSFLITDSLKRDVPLMAIWQDPTLVLFICHLIFFPTRERASKLKIMQSTSNASIRIYWLAQILVDLLWMIVPIVGLNLFINLFIPRPLVPAGQLHGVITLATICFYLSSMFQCYCLSNVLSNYNASIGYLFVVSAISIMLGIVIYLFRIAVINSGGLWMHKVNDYFFIFLLPTDAYGWFLKGLTTQCYITPNDKPCVVQDGSPILMSFIAMCLQMVFYGALLVFMEAQSIDIEWYLRLRNIFPCLSRAKSTVGENREIDQDVVEETAKALAAIKDVNSPHALVAAQLNKSYIRNTKVIENLSFTVNKAECFGLLGVNGAGKTTTFSMLVAETPPDSGKTLANGQYKDYDLHAYRKTLGFDPQATPDMSLTPHQALSLMARLRGVDAMSVPQVVEAVIELLDMKEHTHKNDANLSGGTKRKLALGMALIGNPAVLALDEPTAGVDPLARRGVWALLKSLRTQNECSIIISSHAMEECEAICDRIAIMARGRLRCIGRFLHLRSKFAKGCTLRVQLSTSHNISLSSSGGFERSGSSYSEYHAGGGGVIQQPMHVLNTNMESQKSTRGNSSSSSLAAIKEIADELQQLLATSIDPRLFTQADRNVNSVTFNITDNRVRRSILFRMMRDFRQKHPNVSYMINDASLEDIFISLAREQQDLEAGRQVESFEA